jgi:hypothetical protein
MKLLLALAMAIGLASLPVQQAFACSCLEMPIEEAAAQADAVFTGTVVDQQAVGLEPVGALAATKPMPGEVGQVVFTFAVDGVAKGEVAEQAQVVSSSDGASCGMSFGMAERWLVFTMWDGAIHSTGLCSGNMPLGADEDPPLPMSAPIEGDIEQPMEIPWTAVAVLVAVALLAGVSAFAFLRTSPRSPAS